jgi:hypothetical protein
LPNHNGLNNNYIYRRWLNDFLCIIVYKYTFSLNYNILITGN